MINPANRTSRAGQKWANPFWASRVAPTPRGASGRLLSRSGVAFPARIFPELSLGTAGAREMAVGAVAADGDAADGAPVRELRWDHARTIAADGNGAERLKEADDLRLRRACEDFGNRKDCTDMMERMMLSAISRFPADPLAYMTEYLEKEIESGEVARGDSGRGWGEELHGLGVDLEEKTQAFAARLDFQTICYKLSAAMIEAKPEDAPAFALDFLRKLKAENAEAAAP